MLGHLWLLGGGSVGVSEEDEEIDGIIFSFSRPIN